MQLKIDKESLSDLNINLKKEIDKYKESLDSIIKILDDLNLYWKGSTYNAFLEKYNKNQKGIIESKTFLLNINNILDKSLKSYTNLSEGIHYNE